MGVAGRRAASQPVASGDGIKVAEGGEERLRPAAQDFPGAAVGLRGGIVGRSGPEKRELTRALLGGLVGKGRVGGADDVLGPLRAVGGVLRRGRSRGLPLARFAEGEGAAFVGPGGAELLDEPATLASADDGLAGRGFDAEVVLAFHCYPNYSILGSLCKVVWRGLCWLEGGEVRGTRYEVRGTRCEVRDARYEMRVVGR